MVHQKIKLTGKEADGYVVPLGNINIICVVTDKGMLGCGAFDVKALEKHNIPAATVRSSGGSPLATIDDLMNGAVKEANSVAIKCGIRPDMPAREALELL